MNRQQILDSLPADLKPPACCPECSEPLVLQDAWPQCPNWDCSKRVYGRLQKFVDVLDLKGLGGATLQGLVDLGVVKTPADLWDVTEDQFCQLERKGEKHYAKMREGLKAASELLPPKIFGSLDIEGEGTFTAICGVRGLQTPQQVIEAAEQKKYGLFANAERVTPDRAQKICAQIVRRKAEILALLEKVQVKETGSILIGKTICITGKLSKPRPALETLIKENGGLISSSLSSKTTHLLCNDKNSSSSKAKKARQTGVAMISEEDLMGMLNG